MPKIIMNIRNGKNLNAAQVSRNDKNVIGMTFGKSISGVMLIFLKGETR